MRKIKEDCGRLLLQWLPVIPIPFHDALCNRLWLCVTWFSDLLLTNRIGQKWWSVTSKINLQNTVNFHFADSFSPSVSLTLLTCSLWRRKLSCFNLPRTLTPPPSSKKMLLTIQRRFCKRRNWWKGFLNLCMKSKANPWVIHMSDWIESIWQIFENWIIICNIM